MLDEGKLKRRILLKLVSSPLTLLPFVGGVTTMVGAWALNTHVPIGLFAGLAGILVGTGAFLSRLTLGGETAAKQVLEEMQQEARRAREAALDDLDARLAADGDPRTESALRDLRTFMKAFHERETWASGLNSRLTYDIMQGVEELFNRCVQSLEETLKLWRTAQEMRTKSARTPILGQRERIIREVASSIDQLGKLLVELQNLESGARAPAGLARVRKELDQSLAMARSIDEHMKALDKEYDTADRV